MRCSERPLSAPSVSPAATIAFGPDPLFDTSQNCPPRCVKAIVRSAAVVCLGSVASKRSSSVPIAAACELMWPMAPCSRSSRIGHHRRRLMQSFVVDTSLPGIAFDRGVRPAPLGHGDVRGRPLEGAPSERAQRPPPGRTGFFQSPHRPLRDGRQSRGSLLNVQKK